MGWAIQGIRPDMFNIIGLHGSSFGRGYNILWTSSLITALIEPDVI